MEPVLDITGASGAIPRSDIVRRDEHARVYYEEIRKRTTDIAVIARNTGFRVSDIRKIKRHVFFNEYNLGKKKLSRFDPDYDMAVSWQRLIDGKDIHEMDIVLLKHELMEYGLMNEKHLSYDEAHEIAERTYNYQAYTKDLDRKEGIL